MPEERLLIRLKREEGREKEGQSATVITCGSRGIFLTLRIVYWAVENSTKSTEKHTLQVSSSLSLTTPVKQTSRLISNGDHLQYEHYFEDWLCKHLLILKRIQCHHRTASHPTLSRHLTITMKQRSAMLPAITGDALCIKRSHDDN